MSLRRSCSGLLATVAVVALAVAAVAASGCRADDPCAEPGTACGGDDPVGHWTVSDACRDPAYQVPPPITYFGQPDTTARQMPPEMTSSDWCSYLVYGPQGITNFVFPHDTLAVAGGSVDYQADGSYAVLMSSVGKASVELSAACLTRFAANPSCAQLTADLTAFAATEPSYQNINCTDAANGGCLCSYDVVFEMSGGSLSGRWSRSGNVINHFAGSKQLPSQVDFCRSGNTLTLWGHGKTAIWDQPGLRMLQLQAPQ